jgi:hypothetical protein
MKLNLKTLAASAMALVAAVSQAQDFNLASLAGLPSVRSVAEMRVDAGSLPKGFPPVYVRLDAPDALEDAASASRHYEEDYAVTTKCVLRLNINAPVWSSAAERQSLSAFLRPLGRVSNGRRMFLLLHELAHCVDTERAQDALSPLEKHLWKEVYADMVAVMVMRRYGVPARAFETMASLRGTSFDRTLVDKIARCIAGSFACQY